MKFDLNKNTKKLKKTDLSIAVIIIIGILIVINFFSYQLFYRWDLTQSKQYSISKVTKNTIGSLDDVVNIKAYFSKNLPSQFITIKQEVTDILDEYQNYSKGKIKVEFIDPGTDEQTQRELYMKGIPQLTFEILEKDKSQLVNGYMGIAISYGNKTEVIPAVQQNTQDLEYQITTAIKKVITDKIATVGFLTSNGVMTSASGISTAYKEVQKLYTVVDVNLKDEKTVPTEVNTLIIAGPKEKFTDAELKAINSFVMRGGSLFVMLDGVTIEAGLSTKKNETDLDKLLEKYGLKINLDLVADTRSGVASFTQGFMTFSSNYPFWPKITKEGFSQTNGAVSNLNTVVLPWASSIDINESLINKNNYASLAFTTDKAWVQSDNFSILPNGSATPQGTQKIYNLAVMVNGGIKNAYPDKNSKENKESSGRIIAVGDSDFLSDSFLQNMPDNLTFFQNLVDSLSFDQDLINIRSKNVTSRPIKEGLSDSARLAIRYVNILGLTLLVIIYGMARYYMRRKSKFVDEL
jgi:ABC-2 type transport system permease protein